MSGALTDLLPSLSFFERNFLISRYPNQATAGCQARIPAVFAHDPHDFNFETRKTRQRTHKPPAFGFLRILVCITFLLRARLLLDQKILVVCLCKRVLDLVNDLTP